MCGFSTFICLVKNDDEGIIEHGGFENLWYSCQ